MTAGSAAEETARSCFTLFTQSICFVLFAFNRIRRSYKSVHMQKTFIETIILAKLG